MVVVFDDDFRLTTALSIPREIVEDMFPIRPHVNGRIITVTDALAMRTGITTIDLTAVYQRIGALKSDNPRAVRAPLTWITSARTTAVPMAAPPLN